MNPQPLLVLLVCAVLAGTAFADNQKASVTNDAGMKFRFIPAGAFHRGENHMRRGYVRHFNNNTSYSGGEDISRTDEAPRHPVRLTRPAG